MAAKFHVAVIATLAVFSLFQQSSAWVVVAIHLGRLFAYVINTVTHAVLQEYVYTPYSKSRRAHTHETEDGEIVHVEDGIDFATDENWESHEDFDILINFAALEESTEFFDEKECLGTPLRFDVPKGERPTGRMKECCHDLATLKRNIRFAGASGKLLSDRPDQLDHSIMIGGVAESCMDLIYWLDGEGKTAQPCGHRCLRWDSIADMEYNELKDAILEGIRTQEKQEKEEEQREQEEQDGAHNEDDEQNESDSDSSDDEGDEDDADEDSEFAQYNDKEASEDNKDEENTVEKANDDLSEVTDKNKGRIGAAMSSHLESFRDLFE